MNIFNIRLRRVGGIRFLRIGRLQLTFCVCRRPFFHEGQWRDRHGRVREI